MAGNQDLVTYLSLTPDFGGTRFGPFEGLEVRLGSDPDRCHIVLPASLGVIAEHVKLIRQGPVNLILSPAERTATVFLYRQGERRPTQLNTPTAVRPGDSFALVTPDGPRFIVEVGELPPEVKAAREAQKGPRTGRRRLTAEAFKQEGIRQVWTRILTFGPAQMAQRAWVYIQSGAIYQPRNIILFATIASGWIFGGAMGCRTKSLRGQFATTTTRLASCEANAATIDQYKDKGIANYTIADMAGSIIGSTNLSTTLNNDKELAKRVNDAAKQINSQTSQYEWLRGNSKSTQEDAIFKWRTKLEDPKSGIDADTAELLIWASARPETNPDKFQKIVDSMGEETCGRGQLNLTYRQALHMGMETQPDRFIFKLPSGIVENNVGLATEVQKTFQHIPNRELEEGGTFLVEELLPEGNCIYRDGPDDRLEIAKLHRQLKSFLGEKGSYLPETGINKASVARLAKLYAADLRGADYTDKKSPNLPNFTAPLEISQILLSQSLAPYGEWVLNSTAMAIAKAIVLPCVVVLENKDDAQIKRLLGENNIPDALDCLVLNYKLQNEK